MGNLRVFLKAARFTFRNRKRTIAFIALFTILSAYVIFFSNTFSEYYRTDLLRNKGIITNQIAYNTVDQTNDTVQQFIARAQGYEQTEAVIVHRYFDFGTSIRIFELDEKNPWAFTLITPRSIATGRFISNSGEALVLTGSTLNLESTILGNATIDPSPGDKLTLQGNTSSVDVRIVGEITTDVYNDPENKAWIFVDSASFEAMLDALQPTTYIYEITVLAKGHLIFSKDPYENKRFLVDQLKKDYFELGLSPSYLTVPNGIEQNIDTRIEERNSDLLNFSFGVFAGILLSLLYGILLSRFRKTEIAVLKTVGYDRWNIRLSLLAEILSISFVGYLIGIFAIQSYLIYQAASLVSSILSFDVVLLSFSIVVLFDLPSVLISSYSLVKVRPLDVLRDTG